VGQDVDSKATYQKVQPSETIMLIGCSRTYVLLNKTMAAGIIANGQQFDFHKIDRSDVGSKYIGETEKRLSKIFLKAWLNNLMLFLDGADILLGKR
jgi:SpoVK/Ycf46/Vps4 family AAA+-type ATPase